jgi:hypothetical protein
VINNLIIVRGYYFYGKSNRTNSKDSNGRRN